MGIADFLFEGKAPPATQTYGTTTANVPQFISDYTQGLISRANAIAAEPYQQYGGPRVAGFTADTQNAFNLTRQAANAYQGPLAEALGLTSKAVAPGMSGLERAQPYLQQAGQTFGAQQAQQYMDPYVSNVIDRAKLEANRNYNENILPQLDAKFTSAGQYGSSAMAREANRAARDLTEGLQSNANAALSGAYTQAGNLFNTDQARQLALGQTAGQLAGQQQSALLEAGKQQAGLGQAAQQMGLAGASALDTIGQMQQQQNQKNLDVAYQDFQNQTNYPRSTIDWMSSVIRGMPAPVSTQTTQTGPADAYQPSPLSQLGQLGTGIAGLWQLFQNNPQSNT
jgi:hypothetical protein